MTMAEPVGAQEAPANQALVGADVVRLRNGGLVRGTITQLVPGASVTIVTGAGKSFDFVMAEVAYAGPADDGPAPSARGDGSVASEAKQVARVEGRELATVRFESDPPGMTFHRPGSSAVAYGAHGVGVATNYERLCTAPCELTIAAGAETLAISVPGGIPLEAGVVTIPAGRFRVTGAFESRATLRTAGWLVAAGSLVLLTGAMYAAIDKKKECEPDIGGYGEHCRDKLDVDLPIFLAGCLGGGLGIGIGLRMAGKRDRPVVRGQATTNSSFMTDRIRGVAVQGSF
jgi:hypothetical protein